MSDEDKDPGFQVRDRRGRGAEPEPVAAPEPPPAAEARPRKEARGAERPRAAEPSIGQPPAGAAPEPNLVGLFMMLASFAVAAIDGVQDPATGQTHRDPQQAAELIDVLLLLRKKTEGHRTAEESEALDGLIYDLQLRYVRATSPPSAGPGPARR